LKGEAIVISKEYVVRPLVGTEQIKIGDDRGDIKKLLSELYKGTFRREDFEVDDYRLFHIFFDNEKVCAIEFFEPSEVYYKGIQLIGMNQVKCKEILMEDDPELECEGEVAFYSKALQIGVYAPYGEVESVLVAKSGYYR